MDVVAARQQRQGILGPAKAIKRNIESARTIQELRGVLLENRGQVLQVTTHPFNRLGFADQRKMDAFERNIVFMHQNPPSDFKNSFFIFSKESTSTDAANVFERHGAVFLPAKVSVLEPSGGRILAHRESQPAVVSAIEGALTNPDIKVVLFKGAFLLACVRETIDDTLKMLMKLGRRDVVPATNRLVTKNVEDLMPDRHRQPPINPAMQLSN